MLSNNQCKFVIALNDKKTRQELKLFVAEGKKIVSELIESSIKIKTIYALPSFIESVAVPTTIECIAVKQKDLERISMLSTPNEVLAICEMPQTTNDDAKFANRLTLVLDTINDPGNLGTIIRIADWFKIDAVVCSTNTADAYNPKVVQATMGSIARVKLIYTNLVDFLTIQKEQNQLPVYGAYLTGQSIYTTELSAKGIIVIGSESHGISNEVSQFVTHRITIPQLSAGTAATATAESLNAAIATSIICSEFVRRTA